MVVMVVVMAVMTLMPMLRRSAQSMIKSGADQIGDQSSAEQDFDSAYLVGSKTVAPVSIRTQTLSNRDTIRQNTHETTNSDSRSKMYIGS